MITICTVTGTRADYGLLSPLMKAIQSSDQFKLQILATGMHVSPEFGNTIKDIEQDGFFVNEKIEMLLSADTDTAIVKAIGLGMIGFADAFERLKPDWVLLLGDRFEIFAAATSAYIKKIPIIHLHGGEVTAGATDEALRHSITKMASLHFTSTEEYRKRVLQLGERDDAVFNTGAIGIDNIKQIPLLTKQELIRELQIPNLSNIILLTYHPETLGRGTAEVQLQALFDALDNLSDTALIFTMPNADASGRIIMSKIREYVDEHPNIAKAFTSLGQLRYLSLMKAASIVVGNSSSGVIEAPTFGIPTINIGDRQKGRVAASSVIHCNANETAISEAFRQAFDPSFRQMCKTVENPYGNGGTARKIMDVLQNKLADYNLKKEFADRL